jgi:hypothetical protein
VIAACFCAGQNSYVGRMFHSSGRCVGCTRNMAAILALVQLHVTGPASHLVILCCRVSFTPHREHVMLETRLISANRSCVGKMSCIAAYHVDFIVSERPALCRILHTFCQGISGFLRMIRILLVSATSVVIVSNTLYIRCLKAFIDSYAPGGSA